jgi:hypothetical protein
VVVLVAGATFLLASALGARLQGRRS